MAYVAAQEPTAGRLCHIIAMRGIVQQGSRIGILIGGIAESGLIHQG